MTPTQCSEIVRWVYENYGRDVALAVGGAVHEVADTLIANNARAHAFARAFGTIAAEELKELGKTT